MTPLCPPKSVATGEEGQIIQAVLDDVLTDTRPSVTPDMTRRFDDWAPSTT